MNKFDRNLELLDGLETEYLRVLYYDFNERYKDTYKSYEYNRLCTIIEGEKKIQINDQKALTYNQNGYILLPPNSSVKMEIDTPTKALVLELGQSLIDKITPKVELQLETNLSSTMNKSFFHNKSNICINKKLEEIITAALSTDRNKEFLIDLYAQELTYSLLQTKGAYDMLQVDSKKPMQLAVEIMKNNLLEGITITEIAYALNMSLTNFSAKFKKATGVSPNEYLINLKLVEAKERLKFKSVTEVSFDLGYENISHFIHLFKQKFGITPKQYMLKQCNVKRDLDSYQ
jgi:AraC-like DNA-binding protein